MNGEAIYKRYEVKDLETGEVLDEPFYVLRPRKDSVATSAMFAYAACCKLNATPGTVDNTASRMVAQPLKSVEDWRETIDQYVVPFMEVPEHTDSGLDLLGISQMCDGSDGTVEHAYDVLENLGIEVATVVCRPISRERQEAAKQRLRDRAAAVRKCA